MASPLTFLQTLFSRPQPAPEPRIVREQLPLVAGGAGPLGLAWRSLAHALLGPVIVPAAWCEKPAGSDYCLQDEKSGCVVLIMQEGGVSADDRIAYAERWANLGSNRVRTAIHGRLRTMPVARVEGWRAGPRGHYMRDYFLFLEDSVVMVRGYAPAHEAYLMGLVVDAIVASATGGNAPRTCAGSLPGPASQP